MGKVIAYILTFAFAIFGYIDVNDEYESTELGFTYLGLSGVIWVFLYA